EPATMRVPGRFPDRRSVVPTPGRRNFSEWSAQADPTKNAFGHILKTVSSASSGDGVPPCRLNSACSPRLYLCDGLVNASIDPCVAVQPLVRRIARPFADREAERVGIEQARAQYRGIDRHRHVADERERHGGFGDRVEGVGVAGIDSQLTEMNG